MWQRERDGLFFSAEPTGGDDLPPDRFRHRRGGRRRCRRRTSTQIKPNSGVRALIGTALVQFQLSRPRPGDAAGRARCRSQRDPDADAARAAARVDRREPDPDLRRARQRLERLLTIAFDADDAARIAAIESLSRRSRRRCARGAEPARPDHGPRAVAGDAARRPQHRPRAGPGQRRLQRRRRPTTLLVAAGLAPPRVSPAADRSTTLAANIEDGARRRRSGGRAWTPTPRAPTAYDALVAAGTVPARVTDAD